jgi:hypothetical protein
MAKGKVSPWHPDQHTTHAATGSKRPLPVHWHCAHLVICRYIPSGLHKQWLKIEMDDQNTGKPGDGAFCMHAVNAVL